MKHKLLSAAIILTLLLSLLPASALAANQYDFDADGIYYKSNGVGTVAVVGIANTATQLTIPGSVSNGGTIYTVTEIANSAFWGSSLETVTIPASVTKIGLSAFYNSVKLETVTFADGSELTEIGNSAFCNCKELTALSIPAGVTTIGSEAFRDCDSLESLTIPSGVTEGLKDALSSYPNVSNVEFADGSPYFVKTGVLYKETGQGTVMEGWIDTDITDIVPDGVTEIPEKAFFGNASTNDNITSITLSDSVTTIGKLAFKYAELTTIDLKNVTEIGAYAFSENHDLETVTWPTNLSSMGECAFENCDGLQSIEISGSIKEIPESAFVGCLSVQTIVLPEGLEKIGDYAFAFLNSKMENPDPKLESINIPSSVTSLGEFFLGGIKADGGTKLISQVADPSIFTAKALSGITENNAPTLIYPAEYAEAYKDAGLVDDDNDMSYALSLDPESLNPLAGKTETIAVTSTIPEGYKLAVTSSNTAVAEAALSGGTVTVTAKGAGAADISVSIVSEDESITLVTKSCAVVVGASYTVTVVYGNGAADTVAYVAQGGSYVLPAAPQRAGYAFLGWVSGGKTYSAKETVAITANTTFTASWVRHPDTEYVPDEPETPETPAFPFYDVSTSEWYYSAVKYVYDKGIMDGVDTHVFAPNDTLTRAMVWTMLARMSGVDTTGGSTWYAKAQEWAVAMGISDGTDPTAAITREQLATMLWRYNGSETPTGSLTRYPDYAEISSWASQAMLWATVEGIIEGNENGAITPTATATRAQAAAMFMRYLEI